MNGTTLRTVAAVTCVAALVAPGSALAAKKKHRVAHQTQQVVVPHKYDAGGDGIELSSPIPGVRVNLFDPVQLATTLGNQALVQLGLPPLPTVPAL
jgi:hypothetical protein